MTKNWMDPAVITESSRILGSISLVLTGVALWDVLSTLWFEWQFITGKRKFRWPMIIYEIARISMLLNIFSVVINRNALHEVPCTQIMFMSKSFNALGTFMSSLILVLRTRAVWHRDNRITALLSLLFIGQIASWCQIFRYSTSQWNPDRKVCDVSTVGPGAVLVLVWAYTMGFDLIILVLCSYRLTFYRSSTLGNILLRDGISYFCFVFCANSVQTVMAGLQLNPVMTVIASPFVVVISVIAATTVFRNVFIASDSFYGELHGLVEVNNGPGSGGRFHLPSGADVAFHHNTSTRQVPSTNEIPLGEKISMHNIGVISVQEVVDVEAIEQESVKSARRHQNIGKLGKAFNDDFSPQSSLE